MLVCVVSTIPIASRKNINPCIQCELHTHYICIGKRLYASYRIQNNVHIISDMITYINTQLEN